MYKNNKKQSAYSLVELLVSIALGLILTFAVIQAYLGTKRVSETNAGVGRIQENARFSFSFLREDLKNAGYSSCTGRIRNKINGDSEEFYSHNNAVLGWDANSTQIGQTFELTGATETGGSNWSDGTNSLPAFFNSQVVAGSDVVSIKHYEALDTEIVTSDVLAGSVTTADDHNVEDGSIMLVGNCWQTELFQHLGAASNSTVLTADQTTGIPGNRDLSVNRWLRSYSASDDLYKYTNTFYYIGVGAGGIPSLYRFETSKPSASITATDVSSNTQEIVEGIESMQALYGEDTNNDLNPNRYVSANQVVNWEDVVSVRIGLLLRSPSDNASDFDQADDYVLLDNITLEHGSEDRVLRYSVNSTVKLRNKGLNADLNPFTCDAGTSGCI